MDYLKALKEALAVGLTKDQFHTIWEREMELIILTKEPFQKGNILNANVGPPGDGDKQAVVSELSRNLNRQTRDIRELKLESERLRLELSDLGNNLLSHNKEVLIRAIQPTFNVCMQELEDFTGQVHLMQSEITHFKFELTSKKQELRENFTKQVSHFHEQLNILLTTLNCLKTKMTIVEEPLTKDKVSDVQTKRDENLELDYTYGLMSSTNHDQQVKHMEGQEFIKKKTPDVEGSKPSTIKGQTVVPDDATRDGSRSGCVEEVNTGDGEKYGKQDIKQYRALVLSKIETSQSIEKPKYYQRKLGRQNTIVSQASDHHQPVINQQSKKYGKRLIGAQPVIHGQPMTHGNPMSHEQFVSHGQPAIHGQPAGHGQLASQGKLVIKGQPKCFLQTTSNSLVTCQDQTTTEDTSTDDDQAENELRDLHMLPLAGAELRISLDEALNATEDPYPSSFYYTQLVACKVRLCVRFMKDGHLAIHVELVSGDLDNLHKWPMEFSGNGYIYNTSMALSELWTIKSIELDRPESETIMKAEVCLKTAQKAHGDIEYTKLRDMGYQYNGYFRFLWNLKAKETIEN